MKNALMLLSLASLMVMGCASSEQVTSKSGRTPILSRAQLDHLPSLKQKNHSVPTVSFRTTDEAISLCDNNKIGGVSYVQLESGNNDAALFDFLYYRIEVDEASDRIFLYLNSDATFGHQFQKLLIYHLNGKYIGCINKQEFVQWDDYSLPTDNSVYMDIDRVGKRVIVTCDKKVVQYDFNAQQVRTDYLPYACRMVIPYGNQWFCLPYGDRSMTCVMTNAKMKLNKKQFKSLVNSHPESRGEDYVIPFYSKSSLNPKTFTIMDFAYMADETFKPVCEVTRSLNTEPRSFTMEDSVELRTYYNDDISNAFQTAKGDIYYQLKNQVWRLRDNVISPVLNTVDKQDPPYAPLYFSENYFIYRDSTACTLYNTGTGRKYAFTAPWNTMLTAPYGQYAGFGQSPSASAPSDFNALLMSSVTDRLTGVSSNSRLVFTIPAHAFLNQVANFKAKNNPSWSDSDKQKFHDLDAKGGPIVVFATLK